MTLEYRKDKEGDARGSITLDSETIVRAYPEYGETCFAVTVSSGTVLYAKAKDKETMQDWISAIHLASTCPPKSLFHRSILCEYGLEIKDVKGSGRGIFSIREFRKGEIVLKENALIALDLNTPLKTFEPPPSKNVPENKMKNYRYVIIYHTTL